jgi:hypothetical protein
LAGITSAYFVSLAVRDVQIEKWIILLIDLLKSDMIKKRFDLKDFENMIRYTDYLRIWHKYADYKFNDGKIIKTMSDSSLVFKLKFYNNFKYINDAFLEDVISCLIMSYDSLLACEGNFEKILYYALFMPGNTISVGGYVGGLYGLIYGTENVSKNMIKFLESINVREMIEKFGKKYYNVSINK